jgi:Beta-propeller repeat/Abnormal spindle-like microcephaly-assoc'd, ASPM-SPD-2-Hydin/HYDIN/CFA65/VesB-like, Ig-like domain
MRPWAPRRHRLKESRVLVVPCLLAVFAGGILLEGRSSYVAGSGPRNALIQRPAQPDHGAIKASYARLQLRFEANVGQTDSRVKYLARGAGYTLFLTSEEAVLALRRQPASEAREAVVRFRLEGANSGAHAEGLDRLPGTSNYFIGNDPDRWRAGVPNFARVRFRSVYPGVDVVYYGQQRELEYDFVIAPGADPRSIEFRVRGAQQIRLDDRGDLVLKTRGGEVSLRRPVIYQESSGERHEIAGGYALRGNGRIGFAVAGYDASQPLVIDPALVYSTFLGGNSTDRAFGIRVDSGGNAYVAGTTSSVDFPGALTGFQPNLRGVQNVFVGKLNSSGNAIAYATYVGGTDTDNATGIAIDSSGDAFVTGNTNATDFPHSTGVFQTQLKTPTAQNAFVFKLNPSGTALLYSTYLGGSNKDTANGIGIDSTGEAYVAGQTNSADFPTAGTVTQANLKSPSGNAFVAKLKNDGTGLVFSTYLGGSGADGANGVWVDSSGNAFVVGSTTSSDFLTMSPLQGAIAGPSNAFLAKFGASGALAYSTYLGGNGVDQGNAITADGSGNAYVTGTTTSTNFPLTPPPGPAPFQSALGAAGVANAFVSKLNAAGSALVFSTYVGGTGGEQGLGIGIDSNQNAYVTGQTRSADFPTLHPFQSALASAANAFVTELKSDGSGLVYSTFLGGDGLDFGTALVVDTNANAFVTGSTQSATFPLVGPEQNFLDGGTDAFVAKISHAASPAVVFSAGTLDFGTVTKGVASTPQMVTLNNVGEAALSITGISLTGTNPGDFTQTHTCTNSVAAGSNCTFTVTFKPTDGATRTALLTISDNAVGSPQTVTLTGTGDAPTPTVTLFPPQLDFTAVAVGQKSPSQVVTLTNKGTAVLNITSIEFGGNNKNDFSQTNDCGKQVAVAGTCQITVIFQPTDVGQRQGLLTVTDDALDSPQVIPVLGGSDFTMAVSPNPLFVTAGQSVTAILLIFPANGFNQTVDLTCSGQPAGSTCTLNPTSVTLDGTNSGQSLVTVTTTARPAAAPPALGPFGGRMRPLVPLLVLLVFAAAAFAWQRPARQRRLRLGFATAMLLLALAAGCGGGGAATNGTPVGQNTVTVTGTTGKLKVTTSFLLFVQ